MTTYKQLKQAAIDGKLDLKELVKFSIPEENLSKLGKLANQLKNLDSTQKSKGIKVMEASGTTAETIALFKWVSAETREIPLPTHLQQFRAVQMYKKMIKPVKKKQARAKEIKSKQEKVAQLSKETNEARESIKEGKETIETNTKKIKKIKSEIADLERE